MEWDHEYQKAFDTIKAYLIQSSILVLPVPNRPLIYLTLRQQSLGCMLGQEDDSTRTERAIYYLSKKFTEGESNYSEIEKMCCALVWVMQRLRQYTLYHTIRLLSKADPLRYLLDSPSSMRNIAKWCCQLTKYNIEIRSRGSLISPDGRYYPVAAKVDFSCTNNVAEYEACILGLQAAIDFKVKELEVFGDFMLTIFQTPTIPRGAKGSSKRMQGCTEVNRRSKGIKFYSERPNGAKPTLGAPSHPYVRSHDVGRYWAHSNPHSSSIPNLQINWTSEVGCAFNQVSSVSRLFPQPNGVHSLAKPSHQSAAQPQATAQPSARIDSPKPQLKPPWPAAPSPPLHKIQILALTPITSSHIYHLPSSLHHLTSLFLLLPPHSK
ncbi:hypothetical protein CRG98_012357 [Punica granatum]|uniref:RNase H type-1 domain-containing protein n=1 Tax=Punica granatum TaxID=22663 RepID=A0A2I0KFH0_PUNGR|nr:hypothetical protein CRG98_012357 [Punica granatum]